MTLRLTDLSPELILRIADILLADGSKSEESGGQDENVYQSLKRWYEKTERDESSGKGDENGNDAGDDDDSDNAGFEDSQNEQGMGQKWQGTSNQEVLVSLSRTCSLLYKTLSPYLVRDVTLRNTVKSGRAVQYLSSTEQAKHVRTLCFKGDAPGDEEDGFNDVEAVFPAEIDDVLRNLSRFQNLITVKIDFDFLLDYKGTHKWSIDFTNKFFTDDQESRADIEEAEAKEAWRALIKKTFEAVSCPTSDQFSELVFHHWPLCGSSAFGGFEGDDSAAPPLFERLAKLSAFRLETYGGENGAGWTLNTYSWFQAFFPKLDTYLLDGLSNVTHLSIFGDLEAVIGQGELNEALLPLRKYHVPKLKKLELGYYFVQDDLLEFLIAHSSSLEQIKFHRCFFTAPYGDDDDFDDEDGESDPQSKRCWGRWFHDYAVSQPQSLQRITFEPHNAGVMDGPSPESGWEPEYKDFFKKLQSTPRHRVFPYGQVDDKYGMLFEGELFNLRWALKGADLPGWEEISEVMKRNRQKAANGTSINPIEPV